MTILYLHGLESKLNPAKKAILEKFGLVIAPDLDYHNNPNIFDLLLKVNQEKEINVVIGSGMGGFMGYFIANTIKRPALLFNPALPYRPVQQNIPDFNPINSSTLLHLVLGGLDEIIKADDNLKWISENRIASSDINISIKSKLGHQIPLDIFEVEVDYFFSQLCH